MSKRVAERLALVAVAVPLLAFSGPWSDPRLVVREALRAVEGDSAGRVAARWEERLRRDPGDRDAQLGLASLARLTYDFAGAERRYVALRGANSARPDRHVAYAWLGMAQGEHARGMFARADEHYARARAAARVVGDSVAELQALLGTVVTKSRIQNPAAALALLDSVTPRIPASNVELRAAAGARRAVLLAQLGRPEVRDAALACAALARRAAERRAEASCLQTIALDADRRGIRDSAIQLLDTAAGLYRRAHDRAMLASALQWQGHLLKNGGEYGRARAVLREAVETGTSTGSVGVVAWASLNLAMIARLVQDRASAAEHLARSVAAFDSLGDQWGAMAARTVAAELATDVGDFARARRLGEEQLQWARQVAQPRSELAAHLDLATVAEREGRWDVALGELDSARAVARRYAMPGVADELTYQYGRIALRRGDLAAAERYFQTYLRGIAPDQYVDRYRARARIAGIYAERSELAAAVAELAAAGDELDAWRATLDDHELRLLAFQTSDDEDIDLGVPTVLAALTTGGRAADAFALAEHRRARELADRILQAEALDANRDGGPSPVARARGQSYFALAADIASLIPDDSTALVEYVTGTRGAPTTIFVLTRTGSEASAQTLLTARVLPPLDSLAAGIARFTVLLESGSEPHPLARALGAALLDPALAALGPRVSRIVIVPDGALHRLPFDALRLADGRYVVERYALSLAPSATVLSELWRRRAAAPPRTGTIRVLALGDPSFPGEVERYSAIRSADETNVFRSAFAATGGLPRLTASGDEVRDVARYAPGAEVRLREAASETYIKHAPLAGFQVLHFATHALVDELSVGRAAIALAPGGGEDGFVTARDLAALRLSADLVVLSACRTASGVVVAGEGVQGLTGPLIQAGARSVVATGWRIGDRAAVGMVAAFYQALSAGLTTSAALRAAKLDAIRRGAPPSEWAAFTVVGDPLVTVPLQAPPPYRRPWAAALLVALAAASAAVALAYSRSRRRRQALRTDPGSADAGVARDDSSAASTAQAESPVGNAPPVRLPDGAGLRTPGQLPPPTPTPTPARDPTTPP